MKLDNNCICCRQSYGNYKVNSESEIFVEQHLWPIRENGKFFPIENNPLKEPKGLCPFCNPKSTMWYSPKMQCHLLK